MLITEHYKKLNQQIHKRIKWGSDGHKHSKEVYKLIKQLKAKTVLDYGCGQGSLKKSLLELDPELDIQEYDPAIVGKDTPPDGVFDIVCQTDVMEHIEPELLDNVIKHVISLANKGLYIVISTRKAKVILPDGRNSHLSIHKAEIWYKKITKHLSDEWIVDVVVPSTSECRFLIYKK